MLKYKLNSKLPKKKKKQEKSLILTNSKQNAKILAKKKNLEKQNFDKTASRMLKNRKIV